MIPANRRTKEPSLPALGAQARPSSPAVETETAPGIPLPVDSGPRRTGPASPPSRWWSALRTVAGVVLVAASSVAVAWAARRHVLQSPRFAITDVEVIGCERRTAEAIISESGLGVGTNIFGVDLDAARARVLSDPWIAEATLARRLPGTVLVQVVERKPAALVALGEVWLASADGEPFKKLDVGDPTDFPIVTGLGPQAIAEDRPGSQHTVRRAIDLAAEYEHGGLSRRMPLEEVHVEADGTFALVVGHGGLELVLGGPPFRRKLDQAAHVVAELDGRGAKADAIMLDNDTRPERVVVRMK
jgi:cell division protein FtsQ